tara:strand:+ start:334 stop:876 length:543 start_codon:yes stop_codon:yes gene_type:complete
MIDLHYVNELIAVRQEQHGGRRGAPKLEGRHRVGASLNRSCIVMLSALLQAHVEDVFKCAAKSKFLELDQNVEYFELYWKQMKNWGNPSDINIKNLFIKIGIPNVLDNLSWQRTNTADIKNRLDELNQIRNKISHGSKKITVNGNSFDLNLSKVIVLRNFTENFGKRFSDHVQWQMNKSI